MRFQPISFTVNLSNGIYNYYENSVFVHPRLDKKVLSLHPEPLFFSAWGFCFSSKDFAFLSLPWQIASGSSRAEGFSVSSEKGKGD